MRAGEIHAHWAALPFAGHDTIFGPNRTLVLAPHPDDESLGCGGAIAGLCRTGNPPLVVILTDGTGSHPNSPARELRELREREAACAVRQLGVQDPGALVFLRLKDTAAPHAGPAFEAAVASLIQLAATCETICAPWHGDPHCDHQAAHLMASAAATRAGKRHISYPVWGWAVAPQVSVPGGKQRGWRLDMAACLPAKRAAIGAHRSQHGVVITNDPEGFTLPPALLAVFERPYEVFLT